MFRWYKSHGLSVVPIHPKEASVEEIQTIASVFDIYEPNLTSLSIITPGHVSLPIVKTALLELGVHGIWLQVSDAKSDITLPLLTFRTHSARRRE